MLDQTTLDRLRELDRLATPKPWVDNSEYGAVICQQYAVAKMMCGSHRVADGALIAESRNALRAVLAIATAAPALVEAAELVVNEGYSTRTSLRLERALAAFKETTGATENG
jgi:hypothetical protein